jgi:hypothetical protein
MTIRRAKAPRDQRTRASTLVDDENRRSEDVDLNEHENPEDPHQPPLVSVWHITRVRIGQRGPYSYFRMLRRLILPKKTH